MAKININDIMHVEVPVCNALKAHAFVINAETPPQFPDGDWAWRRVGTLCCDCGRKPGAEDGISGSDRSGGGIHVGRVFLC